jgi:DNA processing protein
VRKAIFFRFTGAGSRSRSDHRTAEGDRRTLWLALNLLAADDGKLSRRLRKNFSSPLDVFCLPADELRARGLDGEAARGIVSPKLMKQAEREMERMENYGYELLTLEDEAYPAQLREIYDPPFVLYCAGQTEALREPAVAVVGTRNPSPYGKTMAEKLAADLAGRGLVVISGLARGIDSAAHWGALEKGKTVAVLGSGLARIYPRENRRLFERIMENGAVVSEFPLDAEPLSHHFPQRNRLISGLSLGLVVVEAAERSGSLISARLALEQDREVMAVPGSVASLLSRGVHRLIKEGAKLVETWEDVAEELPSPVREGLLDRAGESGRRAPDLSPEEQDVYNRLDTESLTHVDELVERTEYTVSEILAILLNLELKGLVFQSPGKYYLRRM